MLIFGQKSCFLGPVKSKLQNPTDVKQQCVWGVGDIFHRTQARFLKQKKGEGESEKASLHARRND